MTFEKPNVGLITMCKYIDENIYTDNYDEYTAYTYIYHIIYDVAKHKLKLSNNETYDMFAIEMANYVFLRYVNKKQYQLDENGNPKMEKIKSVLNYVNTTIGHRYFSFKRKHGSNVISRDKIDFVTDFNTLIANNLDNIYIKDFNLTTQQIGLTCEKFLESIPYPKNTVIWNNIYISVMLTFLNNITPTEYVKNMLKNKGNYTDRRIDKIFNNLKYSTPILFHIPESMNNYISVLTRQLVHIIGQDLKEILNSKNISDYEVGCYYNTYNEDSELNI